MHVAARRFASWLLAGVAACALVTCGHDALKPPREAPPMGPRPAPPLAPLATRPIAGEAGDPSIDMPPCGEDKRCRLDAGQPIAQLDPPGEPASVAPKQPILDAGPDGGAPLPPVPDAGPPIIRDAGQPMK